MTVSFRSALLCAVTAIVALSACSSSSHKSSSANGSVSTTVPEPRPPATITGPVTGGKGIFVVAVNSPDLSKAAYSENEYFASGTAESYTYDGDHGPDGMWNIKPATSAAYKTRIIVDAPKNPAKFSGNVLVEWMNVSAGFDTATDLPYTGPQIVRDGDVWVGVTAQQIGVNGGTGIVATAASKGLKGTDPVRYGSLNHPGDQYSLDIFTQIARSVREPGAVDPLGGLKPKHVLALGESQSAFELTTYINAIQPVTHVFDGFFVHSRGGGAAALEGGNAARGGTSGGVHIRTDTSVPVLMFETETDEAYLGYFNARQPDTDKIRLWDVTGGAHADSWIAGPGASLLHCQGEANMAPTHFVADAALLALEKWITSGTPPPEAPRMDVKLENGKPVVQRDSRGIGIGGIRTAAITEPVAAYSGVPADTSNTICSLFGSTHPFDPATVKQTYPTKSDYEAKYARATDQNIQAGYVYSGDRDDFIDAGVAMYPS
jgi:hypothetical protein